MRFCSCCGMYEVEEGRTQCERCRKKKKPRYEASQLKPSNPNKKLDNDAKSAFESGLTYGKWRMLQDMKSRGEI